MQSIPTSLTIAGTDPTGGAGIQADLKTFQELKSYGMSVITSVVAQNTTGVQDVHHLPISMIEAQLDSIIDDIPVQALKTGMIANTDMMKIIKRKITSLNAPYVMDPVMVTTSGSTLIDDNARVFLRDELLPLTTIVTPNIPETEHLLDRKVNNEEDMIQAAKDIVKHFGVKAALIKGGHTKGDATDFLYDGKDPYSFSADRIDTHNTHGTGCTLSAAITAYLSHGLSLYRAVEQAKRYVTLAIQYSLSLGQGSGPTNHWAPRIDEV
ncbi:bifunctional hydroxymethylpyrimidine kinase/phosphomethylpyrimidine kinase [Lentibacillus jeotgali]|uniref:bifunctional hydroxymethylpyrimidine kinase/phosphomethylpyrimidine kinase n=1 Tax=Lentibacillus jeotgali TaxID=558169 RepID=UPI0002627831|nr:bifunctional hydroxymethylpyrimidine kinase/phosphomethylpyrimidine kinase [Lentibacillus jeotgali]